MKTTKTKTAKFYVTAISTALGGTKHRSTVRLVIGEFNTQSEAKEFAETQARRKEVRNAKSRIRFVVQHKGKTVARIAPKEAI
ncbi:MAG: hypothetical protein WCS77_06450 [Elusimicrobiaceae bacterium]